MVSRPRKQESFSRPGVEAVKETIPSLALSTVDDVYQSAGQPLSTVGKLFMQGIISNVGSSLTCIRTAFGALSANEYRRFWRGG